MKWKMYSGILTQNDNYFVYVNITNSVYFLWFLIISATQRGWPQIDSSKIKGSLHPNHNFSFSMFGLDFTSTLLYTFFSVSIPSDYTKIKLIKVTLYDWPMTSTKRLWGGPRAQDTKKSRHRLQLAMVVMVVVEEAITESSVGGTDRHSIQLSSHRSGTVKHLTLQGALITVSQQTHTPLLWRRAVVRNIWLRNVVFHDKHKTAQKLHACKCRTNFSD